MDIILVGAMLISAIGIMWCEMHDPLSRKFWVDLFEHKKNEPAYRKLR